MMETLRLGSKGEWVEKWQAFLLGVGLYGGEVDGIFAEATKAATQAFQRRHGLLEDGVAGNRTLGEGMRLGFALVREDPAGAPESPPPPPFPAAGAAWRAQQFGAYQFVSRPTPSNPEAIEISGDWLAESIVSLEIPQLAGVPGAPAKGRVQFHRRVAPVVVELFKQWEGAGLLGAILSWDGSFVPRFIRGSRSVLSAHAHGSAFDINAAWNQLGAVPARAGVKGSLRQLVPIANMLGFYWGGHFRRPDGMHFEIARL
jgi:D-alanyl-D-alanine carboxypeptidase/Putative peptidoglycan binding domain